MHVDENVLVQISLKSNIMKIPFKLIPTGPTFAMFTTKCRRFSKITAGRSYLDSRKKQFIKKIENLPPVTFPRTGREEAAVLVPLCVVDGEPSVLFTVRSSNLANHKGDVSFPGGMKDAQDESVTHNAVREAQEEVGILAEDVQYWTTMPPVLSRGGKICISPVVAFVGDVIPERCKINSSEVDTVFSLSLDSLCCEKNWKTTQFNDYYTLPVFLGSNNRIWGLTAFILHNVLQNLCPEFHKRSLKVNKIKLKV